MTIGELKKIIRNMEDDTPVVSYDANNDLIEVASATVIGVAVSGSGTNKTYSESSNADHALLINTKSQDME